MSPHRNTKRGGHRRNSPYVIGVVMGEPDFTDLPPFAAELIDEGEEAGDLRRVAAPGIDQDHAPGPHQEGVDDGVGDDVRREVTSSLHPLACPLPLRRGPGPRLATRTPVQRLHRKPPSQVHPVAARGARRDYSIR